jgi:hypothetical protein
MKESWSETLWNEKNRRCGRHCREDEGSKIEMVWTRKRRDKELVGDIMVVDIKTRRSNMRWMACIKDLNIKEMCVDMTRDKKIGGQKSEQATSGKSRTRP